ncbi:hypothetical protein ACWDV4_00440 [Micromonospora sp. NPDC003197]
MLHGQPITLVEHRRDWRTLGRRCVCGLRWPCPDRRPFPGLGVPRVGVTAVPRQNGPTVAWYQPSNDPTWYQPGDNPATSQPGDDLGAVLW